MRFLAGVGGSACLTIGTGVIADLFVASQRGKAVAMYSMGILFGPILGKHYTETAFRSRFLHSLGPICGGFIAQRAGWRWDMWVVLIVAVLLTAGLFVFNREVILAPTGSRSVDRERLTQARQTTRSSSPAKRCACEPSSNAPISRTS